MTDNLPTWSTSEAKNKLSELLKNAQSQDQIILRHGKPIAVVVAYDKYLIQTDGAESAWDFFKTMSVEQTLDPPERTELMRDIDL